MQTTVLLLVLIVLTLAGFALGRSRAVAGVGGNLRQLHSLPDYYGYFVAAWCGLPALALLAVWLVFEGRVVETLVVSALPESLRGLDGSRIGLLLTEVRNLARGQVFGGEPSAEMRAAADHYAALRQTSFLAMAAVSTALAAAGLTYARGRIHPDFRARNRIETLVRVFLLVCSVIAIFTTLGIVLSLLFEAMRFFQKVPPLDFLFGLEWSPQTALRADQVGASGRFGAIPLFAGTMLISLIAMVVAAPTGLFAAIYMGEYAHPKFRDTVKPLMEILAGIPTVVYGFFAALTVAPFFRDTGAMAGFAISSESALAAGVVMGVMIIPFVSSISDDVITAVPSAMREGSLGLGATRSETVRLVIIPAALPGIIGGLLLAVSRAIGETMVVVMAAGLTANLTANPFEAVTTVTVQIVTLLVGDQEFDSAKTLAAFALGLMLFVVTLVLNVVALHVVNKYREQYE
ncbi:MAG: phosphate ABC transporter permease subunit PstC [Magnetospirillum sp. WYHS-4]